MAGHLGPESVVTINRNRRSPCPGARNNLPSDNLPVTGRELDVIETYLADLLDDLLEPETDGRKPTSE